MTATDQETCIQQSIMSIVGDGPHSLKNLVKDGILEENGSEPGPEPLLRQQDVRAWSGMIDVYVEADLAGPLAASLNRYIDDLVEEGYAAEIREFSGSAAELRMELHDRWSSFGLEGAIFVGDLPHIGFTSEDNYGATPFATTYPHDLYFMDLDGEYDFSGEVDQHVGSVNPEIYVSRITAGNLSGIIKKDEVTLISEYFDKLYNVKDGKITYQDRGVIFADDDWQFHFGGVLSSLYNDVTEIRDPLETTRERYIDVVSQNAETLIECIHSSPTGHYISGQGGGYLANCEVVNANSDIGFLNMFNCSSADFTVPDNLIGSYMFGSDSIVNVVGSTKTGSMLNFENFYEPQGSGLSMGRAFLEWWDRNVAPTDDPSQDWRVDWFYGMTMQGDPTLRPALIGQKNEMATRIETTREDLNSDGTYDKETVARFWYEDDKLVHETELIRDTLYGQESSKEISYTYNELGQEIFREIQYDPISGGIPDVTHIHYTYDERGFLDSEVWQRMEWANPDNVVSSEIHKNYAYRDDGQPTWMREEHYLVYGDEQPSSYREEVWTYNDAGRVSTWKIDDPNMFDNDITRFYTYRKDGNLQNIRLQDEYRFGDDRPRVTESFSYKVDGSPQEHTVWGELTQYGWAPWVQTQYTHTSPGYDKITKLIDLTGDFKFEFKEVTDTWRNADWQDTHILKSYYDSNNALTGRDLFRLTWEGEHLVSETRDYNIWDGVVEYSFTSELLVA